MGIVKELAELLQVFGGWGVSAVLMMAIFYLFRAMQKDRNERDKQFMEVLKETTAALQQNTDAAKRAETVLHRVENRLDKEK